MGNYDIDGRFMAVDGDLVIDAELRLIQPRVEVTKADGSPYMVTSRIQAVHPAAIRYVNTIARKLHRVAHRRGPVRPVPKPGATKRRRRSPEPIPCPASHGVEPAVWDCERCQSGVKVRGADI